MITVPTERPDADAPTPQNGVEQTAADQAAKQQQPPPEESGTLDTVASVVVGTAVDIIFSIFE
jgi:biotin carboxyl carrier protein